ncbi:squalene--hopene cyclase [Terriglobus tenax]|uniref:squalene--hopene cyclase n=1 Tax=Terriglobus tenax TaxID=1111115 RepID=UPI0021E0A3CF|nr:squalene--hopene cyclase [Terriglobus tenax]
MREQFGSSIPALIRPGSLELERETAEIDQQSMARLEQTLFRATDALLHKQQEDGYWCGDLTADSTLASDYVLLQLWLHPPQQGQGWTPPEPERMAKLVRYLKDSQLADGGWNMFLQGNANVNATVKAYTALKILGEEVDSSRMRAARERIHELGGLQACNSYTKINLSLFGLFPREFVPTVPAEILIVPGSFLYEMSSWTRTIIVPLSIIQGLGASRPAPEGMTLNELVYPGTPITMPRKDITSELFLRADKLLKHWERRGIQKIRGRAIAAAERWMLEHLQHSDGLGAIYPAMMYAVMAMDALGYERDQPDMKEAMRHFEELLLEHEDSIEFQPCKSPVWDTAIAAFALGQVGEMDQAAMTRAADWLLAKEVRRKGDWSAKRPNLRPSGWAFEFANDFYPDIDDTAMVLLALQHAKASDAAKQQRAEQRAIDWLLGMQSADGGWAAFDVDNDWQLLNKVPFADHNAMLDPTCADITGRVLEALSRRGLSYKHPAIARGIQYLLTTQEQNGSWYGRWGVNYVYGSFLAIRGLVATGDARAHSAVQRAANWLASVQNEDGGWGESCTGYEVDRFIAAESTPTQTAWALLGLMAAGKTHSPQVQRGIAWLQAGQRADGNWDEALTTGTGFPNVFYLSYHLYRMYFPALALASYRNEMSRVVPEVRF